MEQDCINRTFMELKQAIEICLPLKLVYQSNLYGIETENVVADSYCLHSINRTFMELKHCGDVRRELTHLYQSNLYGIETKHLSQSLV